MRIASLSICNASLSIYIASLSICNASMWIYIASMLIYIVPM